MTWYRLLAASTLIYLLTLSHLALRSFAGGRPMRAREIHAAAEKLAGEPLLWKSLNAALATNVTREHPRFRRVRYGAYQLARDVRHCTG